jgi:hypothetical protein
VDIYIGLNGAASEVTLANGEIATEYNSWYGYPRRQSLRRAPLKCRF